MGAALAESSDQQFALGYRGKLGVNLHRLNLSPGRLNQSPLSIPLQ